MVDPRIEASKTLPTQLSRLTGDRVTYKMYNEGSTVTVGDRTFLTLANTRPSDPKEWKGRVEFKLRHKPQLRHVTKSEPRHCNSRLGKPEPKTALHAPNYPGAQHKKEEPTG